MPSIGPTYTATLAKLNSVSESVSWRKCTGQNGPLISMAPMDTSWIVNSRAIRTRVGGMEQSRYTKKVAAGVILFHASTGIKRNSHFT